ncbi:MAG: PepSY-associated TM helix domain-containing protein [Bacteroidota bacterium]
MRRGAKKIFHQLHLWLGLASGLIVFIVSITGCLYVFVDELQSVFYRDRLYVEVPENTERLPATELIARAEAALDNQYPFTIIQAHAAPNKSVRLQAYKFNTEKQTKLIRWYGEEMLYFYRVYLNPYNGELLKIEHTKWEFFNVVEFLHTSLLLGKFGRTVVAYAVLIFLVMLITGLILWWPRNKKAFRIGTRFVWKKSTRWKRKNYDLHNVLGFYAMWVAVVIAITGLVWSFEWVSNSLQWIANGGEKQERRFSAQQSDTTQIRLDNPLDKIYAQAPINFPEATQYFLIAPSDSVSSINIFTRKRDDITDQIAQYDQYTGEELDAFQLSDMSRGEQLRFLNYSIHVGSILSFPGKVLAFFAALISASLPITGFFIWWNRTKRKRRSRRKTKENEAAIPKSASTQLEPILQSKARLE